MKKHCTFLKKSIVIAIEMLAVLGILGIMWFLFTQCIVATQDKATTYVINPFDGENYEESYSLSNMFDKDSAKIIYYLALCQQFETEGEFDEQKTIDVVEYYYRKQPGNETISSNGTFVYKIQDLINWGKTYGVARDGGTICEEYYPVDGVSIYDLDTYTVLDENLPGGVSEFEFSTEDEFVEEEYMEDYPEEYLEEYNYNENEELSYEDEFSSTVAEEYPDGTVVGYEEELEEYNTVNESTETIAEAGDTGEEVKNEIFHSEQDAKDYILAFSNLDCDKVTMEDCEKGMAAVAVLNESGFMPKEDSDELSNDVKGFGSYKGTEKEFYYDFLLTASGYITAKDNEKAGQVVYTEILESVIYDLCYNYETYQEYKDYFVNTDLNFKYLYLPAGKEQYYSNLNIENRQQAEKMVSYFNDELAAYVVIEPTTKNIIERSNNVTTNYMLPKLGEGTLYLGVLKDSVQGFSDYAADDHYAAAQKAYGSFQSQFQICMTIMGILAAVAVVTFVLYTCMCGNKAWYETLEEEKQKKIVVAKKVCPMKYFDWWFTEIAFIVAIAVAVVLIIGFILAMSALENGYGLYFMKSKILLAAILIYAAICNGLFLFFYGSLIRRIKLGTLWKGSMTAFLLRKCKSLLKKGKCIFRQMYDGRSVLTKLLLNYVPPICANFVLFTVGSSLSYNGDWDMALLVWVLCFALDGILLYILFNNNVKHQEIIEGIEKINSGDFGFQLETTELRGDNLRLANAVNNIGTGIKQAVETSMKDERLKADLITNVSHDIKTPLTSIINYVDLLKREDVQDETIREYIDVLDVKSQRLKQLTEDLVEASKISSGNITLVFEKIGVVELMNQIIGEFSEKFEEKKLDVITNFMDKDSIIVADGRRMWRVFENLFGNIYKYAMPGTRVYVEVYELQQKIHIAIKNISAQPLNINADELTERFIRGDISRSTEGSGLGLSIAKSLVLAQKGEFKIYLDGDLFKATLVFGKASEEQMTKNELAEANEEK